MVGRVARALPAGCAHHMGCTRHLPGGVYVHADVSVFLRIPLMSVTSHPRHTLLTPRHTALHLVTPHHTSATPSYTSPTPWPHLVTSLSHLRHTSLTPRHISLTPPSYLITPRSHLVTPPTGNTLEPGAVHLAGAAPSPPVTRVSSDASNRQAALKRASFYLSYPAFLPSSSVANSICFDE